MLTASDKWVKIIDVGNCCFQIAYGNNDSIKGTALLIF